MKKGKITSEKQLSNSETCTCILTWLPWLHVQLSELTELLWQLAIITAQSFSTLPVSDLSLFQSLRWPSFALTTILNSTAVLLKFEEQITGTVQMKNSNEKN